MDKLAVDWYTIGKMYLIKGTGWLVGDSSGTINWYQWTNLAVDWYTTGELHLIKGTWNI